MNNRLTGLFVLAVIFAVMVVLLLTQEPPEDRQQIAAGPTNAGTSLPTPVEDISGLRGDESAATGTAAPTPTPTATTAPTQAAAAGPSLPTEGTLQEDDVERRVGTPVTPPAPDELPQVFPNIAAQDIAAIRLQDPINDRRLTLAREQSNNTWYVPDRRDESLDQQTARGTAVTLDILPYLRTFSVEEEVDYRQYGFRSEGSLLFVQFVTVLGEEHFVAIGNPVEEPVQGVPAFYALVDDRPEVYIVRQDSIFYLADILQNPPLE